MMEPMEVDVPHTPQVPKGNRIPFAWRQKLGYPDCSKHSLSEEEVQAACCMRLLHCTPEKWYENDSERPDVWRVQDRSSWKQVLREVLQEDVDYFGVLSVDTEQTLGPKAYVRRTKLDGGTVQAEKQRMLVLGTPYPHTVIVDLTMGDWKNEYPREFLEWLKDSSIVKVGSDLREDIRKDFLGFEVNNFVDTRDAIRNFELAELVERDRFERMQDRDGLGTIAITLFNYDYKLPFKPGDYEKRHSRRDVYPDDCLEPQHPCLFGRRLYRWTDKTGDQPYQIGYLRSDAVLPHALAFKALESLGLKSMTQPENGEWTERRALQEIWEGGRHRPIYVYDSPEVSEEAGQRQREPSPSLELHPDHELVEELEGENSLGPPVPHTGDKQVSAALSSGELDLPCGMTQLFEKFSIRRLPEYVVIKDGLNTHRIRVLDKLRELSLPPNTCFYYLCQENVGHTIHDCPILHEVCQKCCMRGHKEEMCVRYTLSQFVTMFFRCMTIVQSESEPSLANQIISIPFVLPPEMNSRVLRELTTKNCNAGAVGRISFLIRTLKKCLDDWAQEDFLVEGIEQLENYLEAAKDMSLMEEKNEKEYYQYFQNKRHRILEQYDRSRLRRENREEVEKRFWSQYVELDTYYLGLKDYPISTVGNVEICRAHLCVRALCLKGKKTLSMKKEQKEELSRSGV